MNNSAVIITVFILVSISKPDYTAGTKAIYAGTIPCTKGKYMIPVVPANDDCEHMKWYLTLIGGKAGTPASYQLSCQYQGPGTPGRPFKTLKMKGSWVITKGMKSNPGAIVYELRGEGGNQVLLVRISDDLLHLLDADRRLMIGNPGWSYTLNRIKN